LNVALVVAIHLMLSTEGEPPRCVVAGRALRVTAPVALLDDPEVRRQLESGLTTSIDLWVEVVVAAAADAAGVEPGVERRAERIEIRFEPWDELFLVRRLSEQHLEDPMRLSSFEALRSWLGSVVLEVVRPSATAVARATLRARVVPFSEAERDDAQRWFARSRARGSDLTAGDTASGVESLLELVMSTAIEPRSILTRTWKLECRSAAR
jgi:hypothetical protein